MWQTITKIRFLKPQIFQNWVGWQKKAILDLRNDAGTLHLFSSTEDIRSFNPCMTNFFRRVKIDLLENLGTCHAIYMLSRKSKAFLKIISAWQKPSQKLILPKCKTGIPLTTTGLQGGVTSRFSSFLQSIGAKNTCCRMSPCGLFGIPNRISGSRSNSWNANYVKLVKSFIEKWKRPKWPIMIWIRIHDSRIQDLGFLAAPNSPWPLAPNHDPWPLCNPRHGMTLGPCSPWLNVTPHCPRFSCSPWLTLTIGRSATQDLTRPLP